MVLLFTYGFPPRRTCKLRSFYRCGQGVSCRRTPYHHCETSWISNTGWKTRFKGSGFPGIYLTCVDGIVHGPPWLTVTKKLHEQAVTSELLVFFFWVEKWAGDQTAELKGTVFFIDFTLKTKLKWCRTVLSYLQARQTLSEMGTWEFRFRLSFEASPFFSYYDMYY